MRIAGHLGARAAVRESSRNAAQRVSDLRPVPFLFRRGTNAIRRSRLAVPSPSCCLRLRSSAVQSSPTRSQPRSPAGRTECSWARSTVDVRSPVEGLCTWSLRFHTSRERALACRIRARGAGCRLDGLLRAAAPASGVARRSGNGPRPVRVPLRPCGPLLPARRWRGARAPATGGAPRATGLPGVCARCRLRVGDGRGSHRDRRGWDGVPGSRQPAPGLLAGNLSPSISGKRWTTPFVGGASPPERSSRPVRARHRHGRSASTTTCASTSRSSAAKAG